MPREVLPQQAGKFLLKSSTVLCESANIKCSRKFSTGLELSETFYGIKIRKLVTYTFWIYHRFAKVRCLQITRIVNSWNLSSAEMKCYTVISLEPGCIPKLVMQLGTYCQLSVRTTATSIDKGDSSILRFYGYQNIPLDMFLFVFFNST